MCNAWKIFVEDHNTSVLHEEIPHDFVALHLTNKANVFFHLVDLKDVTFIVAKWWLTFWPLIKKKKKIEKFHLQLWFVSGRISYSTSTSRLLGIHLYVGRLEALYVNHQRVYYTFLKAVTKKLYLHSTFCLCSKLIIKTNRIETKFALGRNFRPR